MVLTDHVQPSAAAPLAAHTAVRISERIVAFEAFSCFTFQVAAGSETADCLIVLLGADAERCFSTGRTWLARC